MREIPLNRGMRALLGVIGAVAVSAGAVVGATILGGARRESSRWPLVLLPVCAVIIGGGVIVLRGVWRGRIAVRDPSGRSAQNLRRRGS
jgi:hypothetical protein